MCLSTLYKHEHLGDNQPLMKNVTSLQADGPWLTFCNLLGEEIRLQATIERIDLIKNIIVIA